MWERMAKGNGGFGALESLSQDLPVSVLSPKLQEPHSSTPGPARTSAAAGKLRFPNPAPIHTDALLLPQTKYKSQYTPCYVPSPPCKVSNSLSCLGRKGENGHLLRFFYHLGLLKTAQQIKNRWEQRWGNDIKGCRKFSVYF